MHPSSMQLMRMFVERYVSPSPELKVADIGSYDVNGTYRELFSGCDYTGLDITPGPNVDRVVEEYSFGDEQFDVVISGQTLEHVYDLYRWRTAAIRILQPGGLLCVIAPHTFGQHRFPVDCWRIFPDGMRWLFSELDIIECSMNECDTYLVGKKNVGA
jgi:SAM-dependent methyltransferase